MTQAPETAPRQTPVTEFGGKGSKGGDYQANHRLADDATLDAVRLLLAQGIQTRGPDVKEIFTHQFTVSSTVIDLTTFMPASFDIAQIDHIVFSNISGGSVNFTSTGEVPTAGGSEGGDRALVGDRWTVRGAHDITLHKMIRVSTDATVQVRVYQLSNPIQE